MKYDPRDLEWQRRYEENDTPWDKGEPAPPLVDYLSEYRMTGTILVPGCGRGHEARALAAQPATSVLGLDLSPVAVVQAQKLVTDDATNLRFVAGDFFHLPAEYAGAFDWIFEHTCFCAIDPAQRPDYVRAAASALQRSGRVLAIFYLNPDSETGPPFRTSREELSTLFDPHFTLLDEWVPRRSFPGREQRELVRVLQNRPN